MAETTRTTGVARGAFRRCVSTLSCTAMLSGAAWAKALPDAPSAYDDIINALAAFNRTVATLDRNEIAALALTLGVLCFAVTTAILLVRTRQRAAIQDAALRDQIGALKAEADRANALLLSEPQIVVSWPAMDDTPEIIGDVTLVTAAETPRRVLGFGGWLEPARAQAMERAVAALRERGESFTMQLMTLAGRTVEADGRVIGGRAVLRLRDTSGFKRELAELALRHEKLSGDFESLRSLIDALPSPVWARDSASALVFVNAAYVRAVEAANAADAIARGMELLDRAVRDEANRARGIGHTYTSRARAIVAGNRRSFDVLDVPTRHGSAGIGIDSTGVEALRVELRRLGDAHRRTLDQLATGVAIFGADHRLVFYNAAYRSLWDLDAGFLDQSPTDAAVLDHLRAARKLPEERDFREWKAALHEAYRATEAKEQLWHLPDGRTLRVVTTPDPNGGVAYLFEDTTERLEMVRRYDALIRVQGETLDNLAEAVAVFGSDGRIRLHNPAFASMWKLDTGALALRPHIEIVIDWCRALYGDDAIWRKLRATATAIESRNQVTGRLERRDGTVVDLATVPLPDGATLITFQDVTDTVNVERALRERNDALEAADRLKVDFVHHVSYELRSPLTNIIGFSHFLGEPTVGPLNAKQHEYLGYITSSTNALLAIINDILDLATIDAGAMTLNLGPVDIRRTMEAAVEGIKDRLKDGPSLSLRAAPDIGSFVADERRIRQILFNLVANAVDFSAPGAVVTLACERRPAAVVFSVSDSGPGIPPEMKDRVFDWFESDSRGSSHRGPGLGLSIVRSFVELHGGTVELDSTVGHGTTVVCTFPLDLQAERTAA